MIKKLLSIAMIAVAVSASAQQVHLKAGNAHQVSSARGVNPSTMNVIDTLMPASIMPGGCAVSTNTTVNGLFNYVNDAVAPMDSGYIFGTGIIPLGSGTLSTTAQELGQKYNVTGSASVTDIIVWAGAAHGGTVTTTAKVYTESATTHKPVTALGTSQTVAMSAYSTTGNTVFHFATPVSVSAGNFFAAVTVPAFGGADQDTLSILSTRLGACPAAGSDSCSAIKLATYGWYLVKVGFGVNGDLMIFPVVDMGAGIGTVSRGDLSLTAASPNPATNAVNVNFSLNSASKVEIEVLDLTGKVVKTIKGNDSFATGKHSVSVDISGLEAGTYMYSVQACGHKIFSKFVVAK